MSDADKKTFWLDGWEGQAKGGYFIRNDLFKFFQSLADNGLKPVAVVIDGSWNLEVIVEEKAHA
jgi:hypothetical protein